MRFAIITQEVILRRGELAAKNEKTGKIGKNALEVLFLYTVILLHSWRNGICDRTIPELCNIYGLDKQNSYRRLKILRNKGWIEDTKKYIKPILIYRAKDKNELSTTSSESVIITHKTVDISSETDEIIFDYEEIYANSEENLSETVEITPFENDKDVIITPPKCNYYTLNAEKSVIITPPNHTTPKPVNDYSHSNIFKTNINNNGETSSIGGGGKISSENKSEFSRGECLRWVYRRIENGERIDTPERLAAWAYKSGEVDDFIYLMLYPNGTDDDGIRKPRRLDPERRERVLRDLKSLSDSEFALIEENWRETYSADDWAYFLKKYKSIKVNE